VEDLIKLLDAKSVLICSFVSWGIVQAVKPIVKSRLPKLSTAILRISAILVGCGVGLGLDPTPEGAGIGAACGATSTFTVALIKKLVSSKANVDLKEIEGGAAEDSVEEDA
tara:strand:+ start:208 stop:540 length:333 start_codon:yes stop_codon:yes gene_type:complete